MKGVFFVFLGVVESMANANISLLKFQLETAVASHIEENIEYYTIFRLARAR